ncbi:MAG: ornithine acetyltransferase, partial [Actinomycetota bacterium]|nr:ornithine acetyltransferase [Actinomycetota bacterium]
MNKDSTIGIKTLPGGATAPAGFRSGGVACGVRGSGVLDLGLLVCGRSCDAAAVFTRNAFKGAPLGVTR